MFMIICPQRVAVQGEWKNILLNWIPSIKALHNINIVYISIKTFFPASHQMRSSGKKSKTGPFKVIDNNYNRIEGCLLMFMDCSLIFNGKASLIAFTQSAAVPPYKHRRN